MLLSKSLPSLAIGLFALSTVVTVTETETVTTCTATVSQSCSVSLTATDLSTSTSSSSSSDTSSTSSASSTSSSSSAAASSTSGSSTSSASSTSSGSATSSDSSTSSAAITTSSTSSSSSSSSSSTSSSSTSSSSSASSTSTTSGSSTSSTTSSTAPSSTGPAKLLGCYNEQSNVRTLLGTVFYSDQLTIEICIQACGGAGYSLAGVEYGRECWCGNSITTGAVKQADSSCDMICSGNPSETCGGHGTLDIYVAGSVLFTTTTSAISSASSTYSGPTTVPSVGSCYFVGCYSEATHGRALSDTSYYDYKGMTVEKCAASCGSSYSLFGVEWSGECYCGNKLQPGSALMPTNQCQMLCDGDKTEYCGGSSRLDLYYCPPPPTTLTATSIISDFVSTAVANSVAPTSTLTVDTFTVTETTTIASITTCIPQAYKRQIGNGFTSTLASTSTTTTAPFTEYLTYQSTTITTPSATYTPTTTVTTSVTYTSNVCPTPSSTCNNQGLQWAYYNNAVYNNDVYYGAFDPTIHKKQTPGITGVTSTIGGINLNSNPIAYIYGTPANVALNYFALDHQGYIFAQLTGTYTFVLPHPDDIVMLWIGASAYSGWTRANAAVINNYGIGTQVTYSVNFVAGNYYPIRIMFAQAQGPAIFALSVIDPDGTTILSSTSQPSPVLVQFSCDGVEAPPFPSWTVDVPVTSSTPA